MLHIDLPSHRLAPAVVIPACAYQLSSGDVLHLQGPNGIGKTTILRAIVGLERQAGAVHYQASDGWVSLEPGCGWAAYLGHHHGLQWDLTVAEQLASRLDDWYVEPAACLQTAGLDDLRHRIIRHLSAGQKRRLALCIMQALPAKLWVLDEPLTALDLDAIRWWERCCDAHLDQGGIMVVTTHQPWPWLSRRPHHLMTLLPGDNHA